MLCIWRHGGGGGERPRLPMLLMAGGVAGSSSGAWALLRWRQSEGHCACFAWLSAALAASAHRSLMKPFGSHCQALNAPGQETASLCPGFSRGVIHAAPRSHFPCSKLSLGVSHTSSKAV